jgi:hypothetical protein
VDIKLKSEKLVAFENHQQHGSNKADGGDGVGELLKHQKGRFGSKYCSCGGRPVAKLMRM